MKKLLILSGVYEGCESIGYEIAGEDFGTFMQALARGEFWGIICLDFVFMGWSFPLWTDGGTGQCSLMLLNVSRGT